MMNESRTIVITGASAGIGHCIATRQLQQGMSVLGIGRDFSNPPSGKKFLPVSMDLGDLAALPEALKDLTRRYPGVRGVICCAGAGQFGSLEEFSFNKIRRMIDLNLTSQVFVIRAFLPLIKRNGGGDVVILGSEAALAGGARGAVYSASKFALRGLAQSLRQECASSSVRVTLVNPGMVRTGFFEQLDFEPGPDPANFIEPDDVAVAVEAVLAARQGTVFDEINLSPLKKVVKKKKPSAS